MSRTAPSFPHVVIRASAGTGKTFRLAHRFLGLMLAGEQPDHVLAATFARKAAGEIVDRVLERLAEAVENPQALADFAKHVGVESLTRGQCVQLLRKLLARMHRLRVGTLDSFFVQLAGHFSFELGLPLGWTIVDELDEQSLRDDAIQAVLTGESISEAVTLVGLLFKGEVRPRITDQIHRTVAELYDLYRQTTPDAWQHVPRHREMKDDAFALARDGLLSLVNSSDGQLKKALLTTIEMVDHRDWDAFLGKGLAPKIIDGTLSYYRKPITPEVVAAIDPFIDEARAYFVNMLANQTDATFRLLDKYHREFHRLKLERGTLRFDDVTSELAQGMSAGAIPSAAYRLDAHLWHLLLDEFQDTSPSQWAVIRPFAESVTDGTARRSFFCVGDVKQAIYGWRGGVSEIFDCIGEQLKGVTEDSLVTSFRSSQVIIDTVNLVGRQLGKNTALADFGDVAQAWQKRFEEHTTARSELAGHARLVVAPQANENQKDKNILLEFAAREVARLASEHPERTIGVLVRKNASVAQLMYLLRTIHDLPASEEGGNPLVDSQAVCLALSALKLVDHPTDTAARYHVVHSPLGTFLGLNHHKSLEQAVRVSRQVRRSLLTEGYGRTLLAWLPAIAKWCDGRELNRLQQLVELGYGYDEDASMRTDDFAKLVGKKRVEDPSAAKVRVMTVHQAKGLQFDIVVLPELDNLITGNRPPVVIERRRPIDPITAVCRYASKEVCSLLPDRLRAMHDNWKGPIVHEALCNLYVALTRAVHSLHMIVLPADEEEGKLKAGQLKMSLVLRSALAPGKPRLPETVLYEAGTPNWDTKAGGEAIQHEMESPQLIDIRLKPDSSVRRGLDRQSPSGLQGGLTVDLAKQLTLETDLSRVRGTILHAWFETIEWLDGGEFDDAKLDAIARQKGGLSLDLAEVRADFRKMLMHKTTSRILSQPAYDDLAECGFSAATVRNLGQGEKTLEVLRERRFAVRDEGILLQGTIDRVVLIKQGNRVVAADVIDYKSDRLKTAKAVRDTVEYYKPQMEAYRRAVEQLWGLEPSAVSVRLLFVERGEAHAL